MNKRYQMEIELLKKRKSLREELFGESFEDLENERGGADKFLDRR